MNEFARTKHERDADEKYFKILSRRKSSSFLVLIFCSYWERQSEYTPESRMETHESMKKKREGETKEYALKILQFYLIISSFSKNKT